MKTVERFNVSIEPIQKVKIPFNSEIIGFDRHGGRPGINAIVESGNRENERTLVITTFAKELPASINRTKFIGSFTVGDNTFFVFEE